MLKNLKSHKSLLILLAIGLTFVINSNKVKAEEDINFKRLYGKGRYETSASICSDGWKVSDYAIIASGEGFADALSAAPLAKKYNAPILLTEKNQLNNDVKNELKNLQVKNVIIVGGSGTISKNVETELKNLGINIDRIFGDDRYKTSLKIAEKIGLNNGVVVTNGLGYADALAMASIAATKQMPIILTPSDKLTSDTMEFLNKNSYDKSYVLGGSAVVSDNIKNSLKNSTRLSGDDRYKTNVAILNHFKQDLNLKDVYIASGNGYADALSGSALASKNKSPIILMNESANKSTQDFVNENKSNFKNVTIFGGEGAVKELSVNKLFGTFKPGEIISDTQKVTSEFYKPYIKDYQIDLPQQGKLDIEYDINNFRYFDLFIIDDKGNEIMKISKDNWRGKEKLHENYNDIRLPKGKYKIRVNLRDMDGIYTIKTKYTPEGEGFEKEFNNSLQTANVILPNKEIIGSIPNYKDVDYYKFTLNEKGSLKLNLKHNQYDSYGFNVTLLDENNKLITEFTSDGDEINSYSNKVRLPKGTYFVKISHLLGDEEPLSYKLNLIYNAENENYESEPNNYVQDANYIQCNKQYTGNIQSYNDKDYYKVHLDSDSKIKINFKHNQTDKNWRIYLYDKDNKQMKELWSEGNEINKTFDPVELKSGDYYVLVVGSDDSDYSINLLK
ncbi:cell wall-binding repeat-containing protein [Clostridium sporogenes]|uniref:cell wall-binding repeat-containing protein n=1 Tax=Clostridium sporogenes TaxID=1509 RepID=UPI0005EF10AB|nr:cell wall-binding repeat-containing protein [Clostridium sporogenes]MBW5458375.1 cell wall-binding repeat-containing protein [Clostridium sporogenes]NFD94358.1 cell wall-binding repeat-containing protein [Clostridium sporogenes]NFE47101.1 cell wall-binding repeat-containing protein [Clostridium sporogenes]NFF16420.1 cell wall-binding repeat-containing protein [Clostridium sporogenes]NFF73783.1 cell wall-binding repeat-containing protein [Clostridium sporogenes]